MTKPTTLLFLFFTVYNLWCQSVDQHLTRQGNVTFFSYTPVENIKADNNLVFSLIDESQGAIAVSMLMRAFTFEKALMQEHFNESYVESDLYPKATFQGLIEGFEAKTPVQTKKIKGDFSFHGETKTLEFLAKIQYVNGSYLVDGKLEVKVADYNIRIPGLLSPNIADIISVNFNFEYEQFQN